MLNNNVFAYSKSKQEGLLLVSAVSADGECVLLHLILCIVIVYIPLLENHVYLEIKQLVCIPLL